MVSSSRRRRKRVQQHKHFTAPAPPAEAIPSNQSEQSHSRARHHRASSTICSRHHHHIQIADIITTTLAIDPYRTRAYYCHLSSLPIILPDLTTLPCLLPCLALPPPARSLCSILDGAPTRGPTDAAFACLVSHSSWPAGIILRRRSSHLPKGALSLAAASAALLLLLLLLQ